MSARCAALPRRGHPSVCSHFNPAGRARARPQNDTAAVQPRATAWPDVLR